LDIRNRLILRVNQKEFQKRDPYPIAIYKNGELVSQHKSLDIKGKIVFDPKNKLCGRVYVILEDENDEA